MRFSCRAPRGAVRFTICGVALLELCLEGIVCGSVVSARPTQTSFEPSGVTARSSTRVGEAGNVDVIVPLRSCFESEARRHYRSSSLDVYPRRTSRKPTQK